MKNFNMKGKQEKIRKMEKYEQERKNMNNEEIEEMRKLEEWTITENKAEDHEKCDIGFIGKTQGKFHT